MSLKCPHCGHETVIRVSYCPACGEKMPAPAEPAREEAVEAPAETETPPEEETPEAEPEPESPAEPDAAAVPSQPSIVTMPPIVSEPTPPAAPAAAEPVPTPAAGAPPQEPTPPAAPPVPQPTAPPAAPPPAAAPTPPEKKGTAWWWGCGGCGCLAIVIGVIAAAFLYRVAFRTQWKGGGEPETVATDSYEVIIPSNWERDQATEEGLLRVLGPEVNGERLDLQIRVEELAEDVSLERWSDEFLEQYAGIARTEDTYEAGLCDEPARRVALTTDGHDYLIYLSVYKAQGFIIVMIAPEGTMETAEGTFDQVLDEFAMYE